MQNDSRLLLNIHQALAKHSFIYKSMVQYQLYALCKIDTYIKTSYY